jgi:CubicO group peptidase (beta-lactamase class C family)
MLLNHTGGLDDYLNNPEIGRKLADPYYGWTRELDVEKSSQDLLRHLLGLPPRIYSNLVFWLCRLQSYFRPYHPVQPLWGV